MPRFFRFLPWTVLLLTAACRDDDVVAYRVAKSQDPAPAAPAPAASPHASTGAVAAPASNPGASMADTPVATASGVTLTWIAPSAWQAKAGSAMRKGTYVITGEGGATVELAITAFPGDVGGEVANVNRWRGQLGLPALPDAAVPTSVARLEANGLKLAIFDASGGTNRLLGAMVPVSGATWFFKLIGPDAVVASTKPTFLEFLKTVRVADATP